VNQVVESWLQAINSHDVDALETLGSENHVFFVEGEKPTVGKDKIRASWAGYFELCPSYIVFIDEYFELCPSYIVFIDEYFEKPDAYYLVGHTSGSHIPTHLESIPSSVIWRCAVTGGNVVEWSIYEASDDNRAKFDLIGSAYTGRF